MNIKRLSSLLILFISAVLIIAVINTQQGVTKETYANQVLDQYIRYYCPAVGTCTRKKALQRLRRDWPHVYKLGFSVLEENE